MWALVSPLNDGTVRALPPQRGPGWSKCTSWLCCSGWATIHVRPFSGLGSPTASEPMPGTHCRTRRVRLPGRRADLFWNLASPGGPGEPVTQRTNRPLCILFVFIKRAQHVPRRRIRRYILARREKIHGACALPSHGKNHS